MELKYQALYFDLQKKIISGDFPEGTKIPSEAELCKFYKVSRITVRRALANLVQLGFVYRLRGQGTFVLRSKQVVERFRGVPQTMTPEGSSITNHIEEDTLYPPDSDVAKSFAPIFKTTSQEDGGIVRLRMLSFLDDNPYALMSFFMPQNVSELISRKILCSKTFLEAYETVVGEKIATIQRSVSAVIPDEEQCNLLGTPVGTAHLWTKNVVLLKDDSPVAMNYALYNGNVYDFAVELELSTPSFF
ncbi:MAG: GntR family transcriptional regulator [Spirochaetales bacterium]|nr:GntR family transcriptional regulator [Spirochaetales bacterium]